MKIRKAIANALAAMAPKTWARIAAWATRPEKDNAPKGHGR